MFPRIVSVIVVFITLASSAFAGPFSEYVGKYQGRGVDRSPDGIWYYYVQTRVVGHSSQLLTTKIPGISISQEYISFRPNGTLSGTGYRDSDGKRIFWTVTGTWREVGGVVKGYVNRYYLDGDASSGRFAYSFRNGRVFANYSASYSAGITVSSGYSSEVTTASIPEPTAASALLAGGALLLGRRWRRNLKA